MKKCEGPCIIVYTCSCCRWCDLTTKIIEEILREGKFQCDLKQVDIRSENAPHDICSLPTIDLCGNRLSGIPDENVYRNEVQKLVFCECFTK